MWLYKCIVEKLYVKSLSFYNVEMENIFYFGNTMQEVTTMYFLVIIWDFLSFILAT